MSKLRTSLRDLGALDKSMLAAFLLSVGLLFASSFQKDPMFFCYFVVASVALQPYVVGVLAVTEWMER